VPVWLGPAVAAKKKELKGEHGEESNIKQSGR